MKRLSHFPPLKRGWAPSACRGLSVATHSDSHVERRGSSPAKSQTIDNDGLTFQDFLSRSERSINNKNISPSLATSKSFYIKTYGCQMNVSDSNVVRSILNQAGFVEANDEAASDILLTNTCSIRENAERKIWQRLQTLKKKQTKDKKQIIGLLGCMAERLKDRLLEEDLTQLVVGPDAYRELPKMLNGLVSIQSITNDDVDPMQYAINVQLSKEDTYADILPTMEQPKDGSFHHSAFVSIQRGCSNRCSFCIVPFTRGGTERSRPLASILEEIRYLQRNGIKEVVLLGQNVNSYHDRSPEALEARPQTMASSLSNAGFRSRVRRDTSVGGYSFVDLVDKVSEVDPEMRIRFTSPHPKDYPIELLQLITERPNLCQQLHLPAQSGSTTMLRRMKRGYSREAYLELVDTIHSVLDPTEVALSTDMIAGFCDETDEEHADSVSLLEQVKFDQAFLFAYSTREQTHAHRTMEDNVPENIKKARLQALIDTFRSEVHTKNEKFEVGKLRLVLVEGISKRPMADGTIAWHGRTDQNKRILFPHTPTGDLFPTFSHSLVRQRLQGHLSEPAGARDTVVSPGDYAVVRVTEAKGHTLRGMLLWKTTLQDFDELQRTVLSSFDTADLNRFADRLGAVCKREA